MLLQFLCHHKNKNVVRHLYTFLLDCWPPKKLGVSHGCRWTCLCRIETVYPFNSPLTCKSMSFLYGTALLLDICSEMLTLRKLTLLKFSLLARPARATSEKPEFLFTAVDRSEHREGTRDKEKRTTQKTSIILRPRNTWPFTRDAEVSKRNLHDFVGLLMSV